MVVTYLSRIHGFLNSWVGWHKILWIYVWCVNWRENLTSLSRTISRYCSSYSRFTSKLQVHPVLDTGVAYWYCQSSTSTRRHRSTLFMACSKMVREAFLDTNLVNMVTVKPLIRDDGTKGSSVRRAERRRSWTRGTENGTDTGSRARIKGPGIDRWPFH